MNKSVYIIGGGESLKGFDFSTLQDKDIIAINSSILDVPMAKYFITMDYTFIDKKIDKKLFTSFPASKYFVVATNNNYIKFKDNKYTDTRCNYKYDLSLFNQIIESSHDIGIGENFDEFVHGCNSGYSALQLAIVLGYKEIYLLGIDMIANESTHYHHTYMTNLNIFKKRLRFYHPYFVIGLGEIAHKHPDIKIYGCTENSPLNKFIEYKPLGEIS